MPRIFIRSNENALRKQLKQIYKMEMEYEYVFTYITPKNYWKNKSNLDSYLLEKGHNPYHLIRQRRFTIQVNDNWESLLCAGITRAEVIHLAMGLGCDKPIVAFKYHKNEVITDGDTEYRGVWRPIYRTKTPLI